MQRLAQHFSTKDGPGVRTTVFLRGCPLQWVWCHNPETRLDAAFFYADNLCIHCGDCAAVCPAMSHRVGEAGHVVDRESCIACLRCTEACLTGALERCFAALSADDIYHQVMKDVPFYSQRGGVTFSGGEPTVHAGELIPLLRQFRQQGIHRTMDTCGYFDESLLPELVSVTDLLLWDIKDTDDRRHRANTGVPNETIIRNLQTADALGAKTRLRCILLKSINLNETHLQNIAALYATLRHCEGVELLAYHTYGTEKYTQLGHSATPYAECVPSPEEMKWAQDILRQKAPIIEN